MQGASTIYAKMCTLKPDNTKLDEFHQKQLHSYQIIAYCQLQLIQSTSEFTYNSQAPKTVHYDMSEAF